MKQETNFRTLSKRSNIVVELVSLEEARECVRDNYAVYSISYSISNNKCCPTITLLKREPKGSQEGKTIYGVASKLPKSAREKIKPISISDFPFYQQQVVSEYNLVSEYNSTAGVHKTTVHSGLEEFLSLMEELSIANDSQSGVKCSQQKPDTMVNPNPTTATIKLDHEVLKSLYSLAKHLTYNDWLMLTQSLAV